MAYHLSQEARAGLTEFRIPRDFGDKLFEFQIAAVKIAAHHLNKRGGVLIGDVVGLGKTLMATAVARIFEDDYRLETPDHLPEEPGDDVGGLPRRSTGCAAKVLSISRVHTASCPTCGAIGWCSIDESHNLRNREGKRYRAIQEYIQEQREPVHPALRHALQQDLPRPRPTSCGCSCRRMRTWASARAAAARDRRDRVHPPPPVPACARWRPLRRASTPTTGAS